MHSTRLLLTTKDSHFLATYFLVLQQNRESRHPMSLKIIGAGFGRTSTLSTYTALNQLGFKCYHMTEVIRNPANKSHLEFWHKVANSKEGEQHEWDQVFANYTATIDNPACCVWRELFAAYPDAKVLLTVHPKGGEAWYESTMDTIYFTENKWQYKVLKLVFPFARKFGDMSRKLIWQRSHRDTMNNREQAIARYNQHIEEVKAAVPAEQLLIYSADQGWQPLCQFIGTPIPDTEFPNVNDRASLKKSLKQRFLVAYAIVAVAVMAVVGLSYWLFRVIT